MNIVICDDDKSSLENIYNLVKTFFESKNITSVQYDFFDTGESLLESKIVPDIAFLDVELSSGINGITVGKSLKLLNPNIKIFIVTSHKSYIEEVFRFSFYRLIFKPINQQILNLALTDSLYQNVNELADIVIDTGNATHTVNPSDIIAVEVSKRGSLVYVKDKIIDCPQNISYFEELLSDTSFFRTHRTFIVNLRYVVSFDSLTIDLNYKGNIQIKAFLAKRKHKAFKEKYLWYKERML